MFQWDFCTILITLLTAVLIIISIYICETNARRVNYDGVAADADIPRFKTNVVQRFERPHLRRNILDIPETERRRCNVDTLHKCLINDPTTLFGCSELLVRCVHFPNDTAYHDRGGGGGGGDDDDDDDKASKIIPKNTTANEGYALKLDNVFQACNVYHGDLVVVTKYARTDEYLLLCRCKYPGFIGNDNVMGTCTTVRICGGKVKNINKPIDRLQCSCKENEVSYRYNSILPICRTMTVTQANEKYRDWQHVVPWVSNDLLPTTVFNDTVRGNIRCSKLLNPCAHDIRNTVLRVPGAKYDSIYNTCVYENRGIPVRTGLLKRNGDQVGPDFHKFDTVDGVLYSFNYSKIRILDNVMGKRQMCAITADVDIFNTPSIVPLAKYTVALPENTSVGIPGHIRMSNVSTTLLSPICTAVSTSYTCSVGDNFRSLDSGYIPRPNIEDPPFLYLWGTEEWVNAYEMYNRGVVNRGYGLELLKNYLNRYRQQIKYYGLQLTSVPGGYNGLLGFNRNVDNYDFHSKMLT
ncbi:hypothetical protein AGLY_017558 [Aphis glycines]|uniref:Uncharacterized protein n=1 Tax=Aphis glycines TaxID=307491 RepID=A0A6G0SV61_APHGL|nr:hypothetical protein AGLY_017558 [Aphis glycines]